MGTQLLRSQHCLTSPLDNKLTHGLQQSPPRPGGRRKRWETGDVECRPVKFPNLVMGQVTILKRGEDLKMRPVKPDLPLDVQEKKPVVSGEEKKLKIEEKKPKVEAEKKKPKVEAEEKKPKAEVEEKKPKAEEKKPNAEVEEKKPKVEEKKPQVEAEEKKPQVEAEEKKPKAEVEERKPKVEEKKPKAEVEEKKPKVEEKKPKVEEKKSKVEDEKQIFEHEGAFFCWTERLGPEPELVPKHIRITKGKSERARVYAGSGFVMSPAPSALPLPASFTRGCQKMVKGDQATKGLRRLLGLDLIQ